MNVFLSRSNTSLDFGFWIYKGLPLPRQNYIDKNAIAPSIRFLEY